MSKNTGTSELINYFDLGANGDVGIAGSLDINTIAIADSDTDKFLVSDTGIIKYRTGAQLLSDIGAAPATGGSYLPLTGGILTGTTRMDGSGGTVPSITMIYNSGVNRLLAPLLRLYGATNESSNYIELFGSSATSNRTINFPDASGTVALTSNIPANPVGGTGSAGQVAYWTGTNTQSGNNNFFWDNATGNLRVNSSISNSNLTVSGSDNTDIFTVLSGANSRLHVGTVTSPNNDVYIHSQNNYNLKLGTNSTNYLTIFNSGNVLIQSGGTTTDNGARLQVSGGGTYIKGGNGNQLGLDNFGERFTQINFNNNTAAKAIIWWDNTNTELVLLANSVGTGHLRIASTGAATFSSSVTANSMKIEATAAPAFLYFNNTSAPASNYIALGSAANEMYFQVNGADRIVIKNNGNVGIGTSSPTQRLHVIGNALFNNSSFGSASIRLLGVGSSTGLDISADSNDGYLWNRDSGNIYFGTANTERMRITSSGNVLIGTQTDSGARLRVFGTSVSAHIYSDNNSLCLGLGYQGVLSGYLGGFSSALYAYSTNGGYVLLNSSSAWVPASDVKRKRNFEPYTKGLSAILGLQPKLYNMDFQKDGDEKQVGLVAQEVRDFIPLAYEENADFIGINYNAVIVTMVKAIQEQQQQIQELKNKLS